MPAEFGELQNFTVALIGAKEAGKSNYIGVLVHRLANEVGATFHAALNALDDRTTRRYNQDFKRYIFHHRQVIPGTISAAANLDVRYPLNYRFSLNSKGFLKNPRAIALSLFDTAGEDLDTEDSTATHARYVVEADALIFLLDPLQIPAVRDQIGSSIPMPTQRTDPVDIIARAMRIIRKKTGTKQIATPVAVAFSKIDAVRQFVEPNSPIHSAPQHQGRYNESDGLRLHESMRSYLAQWGGLAIDNTMRNEFKRYRYFGLSSFGYAPVNNDLARGVNPFRVEDPFLWLLAEAGFVEKQKEGGR